MKKQFRFTKNGLTFQHKNKETYMLLPYNYAGLVSMIAYEDRVNFIKLLDQDCESWDESEMAFVYFADVILDGLKEEQRDNDKLFDSSLYDLIDKLKISADKSRKQFNK